MVLLPWEGLWRRARGLNVDDVAAKYHVSRAWVHRLVQWRRDTGEIAPYPPARFRAQALAGQEDCLRGLVDAQPDRALAALRAALTTTASLSSIWRALDRLGITSKKKCARRPTTPA